MAKKLKKELKPSNSIFLTHIEITHQCIENNTISVNFHKCLICYYLDILIDYKKLKIS